VAFVLALALFGAPDLVWATASASPSPATPASDREAELLAHCGAPEAGLMRVARRVVERKVLGLPYIETEELRLGQRVNGEPHARHARGFSPDARSITKRPWPSSTRGARRSRTSGSAAAV
jgi:hypothetical protein